MSSIEWVNIDNDVDWEDLPIPTRNQFLYAVLEVEPTAESDEIRRAYHRLALLHHPDKNPPERKDWAEERMKLLNSAYRILSNPVNRREYDRTGAHPHV